LIFSCNTVQDLQPVAAKLLTVFPDARVFAFFGRMGAGKTTFIQAICRELDVADIVQSPSFAIINEYKTRSGEPVFHFDFYRIKKLEEIFDLGYEEYLYSGSYCFIEWPESMEGLLPEGVKKIKIDVIQPDESRRIEF
jgi:tRNA threonylcarbamoyladenosine biosynthesis protein TsaE